MSRPAAFSHGIVRVQAFGVDHFEVEGFDGIRAFQGEVQAASGVFAEHQVLPVGQGEGLFVRAFYGGLYGGAEGCFGLVDQGCQGQDLDVGLQMDLQQRTAALAMAAETQV